ncbi:MAG: hypothetical protein GX278_03050 [Aeromonadales bacterium]|nr:hypothetical protein [Aeromonadales bacterium]
MALINTNYSFIEGSEIKSAQDRSVNSHLIGNRKEDEQKKDTLQDDVVTLNAKSEKHRSYDENGQKYSKALKAYLQNTPDNYFNASREVGRTLDEKPAPAENFAEDAALVKEEDKEKAKTPSMKAKEKEQEELKQKGNDTKQNGEYMTDDEQKKVSSMKARDNEVRVHEQAHKAAGGSYAGQPQYSYEQGPDGKKYVTDGSVSIDIAPESSPQKTIDKMKTVIKAANAPAQPSSQDMKVAAQAQKQLTQAQQELSSENAKKVLQGDDSKSEAKMDASDASVA